MNFVTYSGVRNPRWAGKGLGGGDRVGGRGGGGVAIVRRGEESREGDHSCSPSQANEDVFGLAENPGYLGSHYRE